MKRYEPILRRIGIFFILLNMLAPLSTTPLYAQDDGGSTADLVSIGDLHISLFDESGAAVGGAGFAVTDANGNSYSATDTDLDGVTTLYGLATGPATVTQHVNAGGYYTDPSQATYAAITAGSGNYHTRYTVSIAPEPAHVEIAEPVVADMDLDGVADEADNCLDVANPEQSDVDYDNTGDACDEDIDGDGLANVDETTIYGTDPWAADTDRDGLSDGHEVTVSGTNPLASDTDADGVIDSEDADPLNAPEPTAEPTATEAPTEVVEPTEASTPQPTATQGPTMRTSSASNVAPMAYTYPTVSPSFYGIIKATGERKGELNGTDYACYDIVNYEAEFKAPTNGSATVRVQFAQTSNNGTPVGFSSASATSSKGNVAETTSGIVTESGRDWLRLTVKIDGLTAGETVVVRYSAVLYCDPGFQGGANDGVQARAVDAGGQSVNLTLKGFTPTPLTPPTPTFSNGTCLEGQPTQPTFTAPTSTAVFKVTNTDPVDLGNGVTRFGFSVEVIDPKYVLPTALPDHYTRISDKLATYSIDLNAGTCGNTALPTISISDATCRAGEVTQSQVTVSTDGDGITGTVSPNTPQDGTVDQMFTVTLTLGANRAWPAGLADDGWTITGSTATKTFTVEAGACLESALPEIKTTAAVCENGAVTSSQVTATGGTGFTVSVDPSTPQDGTQAQIFIIEVTLQDGYAWPADMSGWAIDGLSAYLEVTVPAGNCAEVMLQAPDITGNVCVGGTYAPPTVTGIPADGVTYSGGVVNEETGAYTLTATLDSAYRFGNLEGTGWVPSQDGRSATYSDTLTLNLCDEVAFPTFDIDEAVCRSGEVTEPTIEAVGAEGVSISFDPAAPYAQGQQVRVTATLENGYEWPAEMGDWTPVDGDPLTATTTVTFKEVTCEEISPALPEITDSVCRDGESSLPSITVPADVEGQLDYSEMTATDNGDGTITFTYTVTVEDGYVLPDPLSVEDYARVSGTEARYAKILPIVPCEDGAPEAPQIDLSVCEPEGATTPTITVPQDNDDLDYGELVTTNNPDGSITYSFDVTVKDGYALSPQEDMPEGYDRVSNAYATYSITLERAQCDASLTLMKSANKGVTDEVDVGTVITYSFEVTNTGDLRVSDITVNDPLPNLVWDEANLNGFVGTLDPNESRTITATYTVTSKDAERGYVHNVAIASGTSSAEQDVRSDPSDAHVPVDQRPSLAISMVCADVPPGARVGDFVSYPVTIINDGNVTITVDAVETFRAGTVDPAVPDTLAPDEVFETTFTTEIRDEDAWNGNLDTIFEIYGWGGTPDPNTWAPRVGYVQLFCDFDAFRGLEIDKSASPDEVSKAGDQITFNFEVTNTGDVTLSNVVVVDGMLAEAGVTIPEIDSLAPGESKTVTATYTVTQGDIDAGNIHNSAYATDGETSSTPDTTDTPATQDAAITIDKEATNEPDAGYSVGSTVNYRFTVKNTGNVTLTNVVVADPKVSDLTCGDFDGTLDPNETVTCTATYTVLQTDVNAGKIDNAATVEGTAPGGAPVSDDAIETVKTDARAEISLTKVHGENDKLVKGETVTYTFTATNSGTVTLTNVNITDTTPLAGLSTLTCTVGGETVTNGSASLQPGDQLICQATYVVQQGDVNAGKIENSARVDARYGEKPVSDTANDTLDGTRTAGVEITKTASKVEGVEAGDEITYTYSVQNTGNVTLTNVTVTDDKIASGRIDCGDGTNMIAELQPGSAAVECTATVEITQAMIDGFTPDEGAAIWSLTNVATVTGDAPEGVDDPSGTASETITGSLVSSIHLDKTADKATDLKKGDDVTYTLVATNNGDVTLTNVTITDPMFPDLVCETDSLAPDEKLTCEVAYTVTQDDVDLQDDIVNLATATGTDPRGGTVNDEDDATISVVTAAPALKLEKSVSPTSVSQPQDVTYTFTVTNTGNVTVSGIGIYDEMLDGMDVEITCPDGVELKPGESLTCTSAPLAVTQTDINAGEDIINEAQASGWTRTESRVNSNTDDATVTMIQNPVVTLTKTAIEVNDAPATLPVAGLEAGDTVTYRMVATNNGNVTLTNVSITDPMLGTLDCTQPATLDPGQSLTCTGTYTVTQADVNAQRSLVNTATVTTNQTEPKSAQHTVTPVLAGPGIALEKTVVGEDANLSEGNVVTYKLVARNSGNVTLTNVSISDPMLGSLDCTQPVTLAPGETLECFGTYTITQDDVDAQEEIVNTATTTGTPPQGEDVTGTASATITVEAASPTLAIRKSATTVEDEQVTAGSVISYAFLVTNTGNVTLDGIVVDDPLSGLVWDQANPGGAVGELAPNASTTIYATYTVRAGDVEAGKVENCATAMVEDTRSEASCQTVTVDQAPAIELLKAGTYNAPTTENPYGTISYSFTVTNIGDVTLTGIVVNDPLLGASDILVGTLAPEGSRVVTGTYVLTQADLDNGERDNTATVTATPPQGENVSDTDDELVTLPQEPGLTVVKSVSPETVTSPQDVTYTFEVTNTGNVTLHDVTIDEGMSGLTWQAGHEDGYVGTLVPGASLTITATYAVTQEHIDAGESIVNVATATGYDQQEDPITSGEDDATVTIDQDPAIVLAKQATAVNGEPVETETVAGLQRGDVVTYTLTARNSGNVTLTDVEIDDPMLGTLDCEQPVTLAPNETLECTGTYSVTLEDINAGEPIVNIATVTATPPQGEAIGAKATETVYPATQAPALALEKTATAVNGTDVSVEDGTYPVTGLAEGDVVTYTLVATNTGNITLDNVVISDPMLGDLTCDEVTSLDPGESLECSGTYTVAQDDIDAGEDIVNVATASSAETEDVTATETVGVEGATPGISLTKTAILVNGGEPEYYPIEHLMLGDEITFEFVVANTGNVTLTGVEITDEFPGLSDLACDPAQPAELAPGATMTCTATYEITQDDLNARTIVNEATVTGVAPDETTVSDSDDETLVGHYEPRLELDKRDNRATYEAVGEIVNYTFIVENTGNITLTNVQVDDPMVGMSDLTCDPGMGASLAPGARMTCRATYEITQEDLDRGSLTNRATATSNESAPDSDAASSNAVQNPVIWINKEPNEDELDEIVEGTVITYTFEVRNTGNVTLSNVRVADELPGVEWTTTDTIGTLAPGKVRYLYATYTVTTDDVERGYVLNVGIATGEDPNGDEVRDEDDERTNVDQTLSLAISKVCPDVPAGARVDASISYPVTVTNDGTVTLTGVVVNESREGEFDSAFPTTFAPGQTETRIFTTVITADDAENGNLDNTVSVTGYKDTRVTGAEVTIDCAFTPVRGLAIEKTASTPEGEEVTAGTVITYTFAVTNTGDVTLNGIVVEDELEGLVWDESNGTVGTLAPGASETITATYIVTADDVESGNVHNTAIATDGETDSPPDETDTPVTQNPGLAIVKSANVSDEDEVTAGTVVTYTFAVTNTGDVTLGNVTITDELEGLTWSESYPDGVIGTVVPGTTVTVTATYTVTAADVEAGNVHNLAIVTGDGPGEDDPRDEDEVDVPVDQNPAIELDKRVTLVNGGDPEYYPIEHLMLGDVMTYQMTATNTGDVTLTDVTITDPMEGLSALECDIALPATLTPGESVTCTTTYEVTQEDLDNRFFINVATVTGTAPDGSTVSDTDDEEVVGHFEPILVIEKAATTPDGETVTAGTAITYTFTVTNTGNITVHDIVVVDELAGLVWDEANPDGVVGTLAIGESATVTATYVVTAADVEAGNVHNSAIATGETTFCLNGECTITSDPDVADVPVAQGPALRVEKSADPVANAKLGDTISYTFVATNTGDVTITGIVVDDPMLADAGIEIPVIGDLAPGESATVTATYIVTQADVDAGTIVNVATVKGTGPEGEIVSPPDEVTVVIAKPDAPAPAPQPAAPPKTDPVTGLPITGSGDAADAQTGLWMLAATGALALAAAGYGIRRRFDH